MINGNSSAHTRWPDIVRIVHEKYEHSTQTTLLLSLCIYHTLANFLVYVRNY